MKNLSKILLAGVFALTMFINVNAEGTIFCKAGFSYYQNPATSCICLQFTDESVGDSIINWQWEFGEGHTSDEQNPFQNLNVLPYDTTNVCLLIITADGCTDTLCKPAVFIPGITSECQADFTYFEVEDSMMTGGKVFRFVNQSISGLGVTEYYWDFGDGTFSNEWNPIHSYPLYFGAPTSYNVCLTIWNNGKDSCTSTLCKTVDLGGSQSECQAGFTYGFTDTLGTIILFRFTDESVGNNIISWYWDFGDGTYGHL